MLLIFTIVLALIAFALYTRWHSPPPAEIHWREASTRTEGEDSGHYWIRVRDELGNDVSLRLSEEEYEAARTRARNNRADDPWEME